MKQNANAEKGRLTPSLSAKEARVEKRKARWLAKVEAAKAKRKPPRAPGKRPGERERFSGLDRTSDDDWKAFHGRQA